MAGTEWNENTKRIVAATVARDLNPNGPEMAHFQHLCETKGLDPLAKEIWCVMRGNKPTFMLSIDGFLKLANSTGQLDGIEIEFFDGDGNASEVWLTQDAPAACVARAYRKGCSRPFSASCRHAAYAQNSPLWKKLPEVMLSKVATTLALRRGFSDVLAGLHSPEEMAQSGMVPPEALGSASPAETQQTTTRPVKEQKTIKAEPANEPQEIAQAASALPPLKGNEDNVWTAFYTRAQKAGLNVQGLESLQAQFKGDLSTANIDVILKNKLFDNSEKVSLLNNGLTTLGQPLPQVLPA